MDTRKSGPSNHSYKIAAGALLTGLCWLLLLGAGYLPTGRFFVLMIASFVIVVAVRETGMGGAFLVYLLSSLLALLSPGVITATLFALFFGILPLLIVWLRRFARHVTARLITHVVMTALLFVLVLLFSSEIFTLKYAPSSWLITAGILAILLQLFLFVYQYALGQFESFYEERIAPLKRRNN
ncbi:MAG: hypothetical protein GX838_01595 [Clostridiaceae bacterium]|nr:hypothetical protein [Clostridiaceae bacterium]